MISSGREGGRWKHPVWVPDRAVWERRNGSEFPPGLRRRGAYPADRAGPRPTHHGSVERLDPAHEFWVGMSVRRLAIAFTSAALVATPVVAPIAAHADSRDLPRPSRSEAPARFGTVAYSQWYAKQAAAIRYGWGPRQFRALKTLWFRESSWNHKAVNPSSGAWGIPQSLPASKMRTHGKDYRTNPETQIDWGLDYIKERYGSPVKAWAFWQRHHWY